MKCQKCGAELAPGVAFCRECGTKVELKKRFCRECGAEFTENVKNCANCGAKVDFMETNAVETEKKDSIELNQSRKSHDTVRNIEPKKSSINTNVQNSQSVGNKIKTKAYEKWESFDLFLKVGTVGMGIAILLLLIALISHKGLPIFISLLQVGGLIVAILLHKGIIKSPKSWLEYLALVLALLFSILNIMSYSLGSKDAATDYGKQDISTKTDWSDYTLSTLLPEPQSNKMELIYDGQDWLNITVRDYSKDNYKEYVRWCKADYGFTVESGATEDFFSAKNEEGYSLQLYYTESSKELSINLSAPTEEEASESVRKQKNGFDSSSNEIYTLGSYTVEIPKYWTSNNKISDGIQRYAETDGKVAMLQVTCSAETDDDYDVSFAGLMADNDNMIKMIEATAFKSVTDYEVIDTGSVKGILYKGTLEVEGLEGDGYWFTFASESDRSWCTIICSNSANTEYLYDEDFMQMISSIKKVEMDPKTPAVSEAVTEESTAVSDTATTIEEKSTEEQTIEEVIPSGNLTVDNCPELAAILSNKAEIDASYSSFASKYMGRIIEFDGRIDYCTNHGSYQTRFDYLVSAGDYDPDHQIGPTFKFEDVNYTDLHTDLDTVSVGLNVHIVAEVVSFNSNTGLFFLEPVSVRSR